MAEGKISRIMAQGFGFIDDGSPKGIFFHSSSVQDEGFNELREGQRVSFEVGKGPKGPRAENVQPL